MLSENTVKLFRNSCRLSNELYDQGGMVFSYEYKEGMNHTITNTHENLYSAESLNQLSCFIEVATSNYEASEISALTQKTVNEWIGCFCKDFNGLKAYLQHHEEDGSYSTITLLFVGAYGFHSLEFFWSLD